MKLFLITWTILLFVQISAWAQTTGLNGYPSELRDYQKMEQKIKSCDAKEEAEKDYLTLLGIVDDLAQYRAAFLKNRKFINLFPTAYYHTTISEMRRIADGEFTYPIEKMKQMISFYDAYKFNRQNWDDGNKNAVEEHWKEHFTFAETEAADHNLLCARVGHVLTTGILAHVTIDLPRAIRFSFATRFDKTLDKNNEAYISDFMSTNEVFGTTVQKTIADVAEARPGCLSALMNFSVGPHGQWMIDLNNFIYKYAPKSFELKQVFTDKDVIHLREQAWHQAFTSDISEGMNGYTLLGQPVTDHVLLITAGKKLAGQETTITEETKNLIKKKTFAYFNWLVNTWDQKSTPEFELLTAEHNIKWKEIERYLAWLNTNSPFLGCNFIKNMIDYFTEVNTRWSSLPKNLKQTSSDEYDEIFYDWEAITKLDGGGSSSDHLRFSKVFDPDRVFNITLYPNDEILVSIVRPQPAAGKLKDLDLLWKKEFGEWKIAFTEFLMPRWKNAEYQEKLKTFYNSSRQ